MNDELGRLHRLVGDLSRRERALLLWQVLFRAATVVALSLLVAVVVVWRGVPRPEAVTWLVLGVGIGGWFAVGAPLLQRWRRAGDPMVQARRFEALEPELRGRLVTVVGHANGVTGGESAAILDLVARRALRLVERHEPAELHPPTPVRRWLGLSTIAWVVALLVALLGPVGPRGVLGFWLGGTLAEAAMAEFGAEGIGASAHVGDLTLRYVYPDYTGLDPLEVINSTGEAHGPPGTRVEVVARSADEVEAASLVAYDEPALDARVGEGRTISASFVIQAEPGTYQLLTHAGGETRASRAFPIVVEPDLAPEVTLDVDQDVIEWPVDELLQVPWEAADDYGVRSVVLQVDGEEVGAPLDRPTQRLASVQGVVRKRPSDLGMVPGMTYELTVAAWDNDTVSGSKMGVSNVLRIVVVGEDGVARLTEAQRVELLDLLVDLLADHLEDPFPPGRTGADFARWGEAVYKRYEPLAAFVESYRSPRSKAPDWPPVEGALEDGQVLVRYTQVSFLGDDRSRANDTSVLAVETFRNKAIESVEIAVLHLDALLRNEALKQLGVETESLAAEAEELRALLQAEEVDPQAMLLSVDMLGEYLDTLQELAKNLGEGGLRNFVEARTDETERLLQASREAMAAKDEAGSRQLMERVTQRLDELAEGIREEMQRRIEGAQEEQSGADDLKKTLEELGAEQARLSEQVQQIQDEGGESYRKAVADLWKALEQATVELREHVDAHDEEVTQAGRIAPRVLVEDALERSESLVAAAEARDLSGLRTEALDLNALWMQYKARFDRPPGAPPIETIRRDIDAVLDLVAQLERKEAAGDPELRAKVRTLERDQRQLQERLSDARQDARRVAREMSVTPRNLEPALNAADQRMGDAGSQLRQGDGMQAQGSQQAAGQHIREAIEALEDAQQQLSGQSQEMEQKGDGKGQGDKGEEAQGAKDGEGDNPSDPHFELPEPEDFRTPEAYRQALLRGMEGDVPEEYRALKRRYYEELVHQ